MKKNEKKKRVKIARKSLKANMHIDLIDYLLKVAPENTAPKSKLAKTIKKASAQLAEKIAKLIPASQLLLKETENTTADEIKVTETASIVPDEKKVTRVKAVKKTKTS